MEFSWSFYLLQVSKDDPLPKTICKVCRTKLENHYKFATMALKTQDTLNMLYDNKQQCPSTSKVLIETQDDLDEQDNEDDEESGEDDDENEEDNENEEESETDHSGSLLHSILTNVSLMGI